MAKKKRKGGLSSKVTANAKRQKSQRNSFGYLKMPDGVSLFKPEPGGKAYLDFIPYIVTDENHPDRDDTEGIAVEGTEWYKRPFKVHSQIGPNKETVVCPTSFGKKCPICEYRATRQKASAPTEELRAYNAKKRNLYLVIPKNNKEYDEKLHIWDMSQFLFQELLNDDIDEGNVDPTFADIEDGVTLRVKFKSDTMGDSKPFARALRIDNEPDMRDEPYDESILKEAPSLDEVLNVLSYKQLEAMLFDSEEDDEDDEPDEKPRKKTTKKQPEPEEEEDDDDDEEEEKPAKKTRKPAKKKAKEEEDEDDDEDDEPEEKPKKSSKGKAKSKKAKKEVASLTATIDEEEEETLVEVVYDDDSEEEITIESDDEEEIVSELAEKLSMDEEDVEDILEYE